MISFGIAGESQGDHHALAHAARELVRVLRAARARDADALEQLADARLRVGAGLVQADRLGDLAVDPHHGSSAFIAPWKTETVWP